MISVIKPPCSKQFKAPAQKWEKRQLLIRLNDDAVLPSGYIQSIANMLALLATMGAKSIESMRYLDRQFVTKLNVLPGPPVRIALAEENSPVAPEVDPLAFENAAYRNELAMLLVSFKGVVSDDVIQCLRTIPGVRYIDRVPIVDLVPPSEMKLFGGKSAPKPAKNIPPAIQTASSWWKGAVNCASKSKIAAKIAVLDDKFHPRSEIKIEANPADAGNYVTHGDQVVAMILDFLEAPANSPLIECWCVEEGKAPLKKFGQSRYLTALQYVRTDKKCRVVNLSRGLTTWTMAEREEMNLLDQAGVVVVAAAGQSTKDLTIHFPAGFQNVLSVGSVEETQPNVYGVWDQSNFRFDFDILSCLERKTDALDVVAPHNMMFQSSLWTGAMLMKGTSFATPIVAALAAALVGKDANRSAQSIRDHIRLHVRNNVTINQPHLLKPNDQNPRGAGLIDWDDALTNL